VALLPGCAEDATVAPAPDLDFSEFQNMKEGAPRGAAALRPSGSEAAAAEVAAVATAAGGATALDVAGTSSPEAPRVNQVTADPASGPRVAATVIAATIYRTPHTAGEKIGYLRLGGQVARAAEVTPGNGCKGQWYRIEPHGYVCTDEATTDLSLPLVRAASRRPDLSKPMPYAYGFVRATAPQYLRIPSASEQQKSEFKLDEHLKWYADNFTEVQRVELGANDVPLDAEGYAKPGQEPKPGVRLSTQLSVTELLGGTSPSGQVPFWLKSGRTIPNVSAFQVPEYAIFADRVRRKTGLSFIDSFVIEEGGVHRRFALTVDLRLIPATKIKPDTASRFHGVELDGEATLPLAFVLQKNSKTYKLIKGRDEAREDEALPWRAIVPLTGNARIKGGKRYYQIARLTQRWLAASDIAVAAAPAVYPPEADAGKKWIDISLEQQTLVLYEGRKPVYATLVSSGRDGLKDPKTTLSTPQGNFYIRSKHIAAAMDSEENSSVSGGTRVGQTVNVSEDVQSTIERLKQADAAGEKLSADDRVRLKNIERGRDPEYGVTKRRGSGGFELRDVPWIQYFAAGYALHGAYWHDVFGTPRSHGCVNLAPIDARYVFFWTDPQLPSGWHGMNVHEESGKGTLVSIRP
jgi:lipoprotein-anchoring transpeptidase ErfK/SrfK